MNAPLSSNKQFDAAAWLREVAADAQMVAYRSPAQNALLVGAAEIDRLRAALERIVDGTRHGSANYSGQSLHSIACEALAGQPVETSG